VSSGWLEMISMMRADGSGPSLVESQYQTGDGVRNMTHLRRTVWPGVFTQHHHQTQTPSGMDPPAVTTYVTSVICELCHL